MHTDLAVGTEAPPPLLFVQTCCLQRSNIITWPQLHRLTIKGAVQVHHKWYKFIIAQTELYFRPHMCHAVYLSKLCTVWQNISYIFYIIEQWRAQSRITLNNWNNIENNLKDVMVCILQLCAVSLWYPQVKTMDTPLRYNSCCCCLLWGDFQTLCRLSTWQTELDFRVTDRKSRRNRKKETIKPWSMTVQTWEHGQYGR